MDRPVGWYRVAYAWPDARTGVVGRHHGFQFAYSAEDAATQNRMRLVGTLADGERLPAAFKTVEIVVASSVEVDRCNCRSCQWWKKEGSRR